MAVRRRVAVPGRVRELDVEKLERDLAKAVRGEVRFDASSRALYATDASNYRQVPIGVVVPLDREDIVAAVAACREHGAPVLPRGGGTSLAGQCCNVAVVIDASKHVSGVLDIDPARRTARVLPGTRLDELRTLAQERHGLTFGPDPSTHGWCTLGGMIGNDSCGVHAQMAGRTADNVEELEVLTYDGARFVVGATTMEELSSIIERGGRRGEIHARLRELRDRVAPLVRARFPEIPRRVSGYNLDELLPERGFDVARALVGTEGTCVVVLEALLRLIPWPSHRALVVVGYPTIYDAADHLGEVLLEGPIGLEAIDDKLVANNRVLGRNEEVIASLPPGRGWLIAEVGASSEKEVRMLAARLAKRVRGAVVLSDSESQKKLWDLRESGLGATARVPGQRDTWEGWEDSAVPPDRLGEYLRRLRALYDEFGYDGALYGHFGQGCVHTRIDFELVTREGIARYRAFIERAADLVVELGGSLSGEHGDGQSRGELLEKMYGGELVEAFREFKEIWDPTWSMNPGKVVLPRRLDEDLRVGPERRVVEPVPHFSFPDDDGSLARATTRCVGVGKCRKLDGGTMCPSYMVTREEKHSTRGRAHLLFELLRGDSIIDDEDVLDALDLCLACKGCKGECPVNVDVATYKAEFLAQHYRGRVRPRAAYAFGLVTCWARLASKVPQLANALLRAPGLSAISKTLAGIGLSREAPALAPETFREWFARRNVIRRGKRVLLWVDTWSEHFQPEVARAAVLVLETAGFAVELSPRLCCGRPLYDHGRLDRARTHLQRIMDAWREPIRSGAPIVALEPSCLAVFKDELRGFFPDNVVARRLREAACTFADVLGEWQPPRLAGRALVQGHCHQVALLGMGAEKRLLERMGLDVEVLDAGCCGMAGSFGFEASHVQVSRAIGERVLLPRVREAPSDALVVADGFSCQHQIAETGRRALHVAQVVHFALEGRRLGPFPERAYLDESREAFSHKASRARSAIALAVLGASALGLAHLVRRRRARG